MFLQELKNFSKKNWWIFLLLFFALLIIGITGTGNLIEIFILFFLNFLGNVFIMIMQANYSTKNNKIGSLYHLSATLLFTSISIYGFFFLGEYQYLIWQIAYIIATIKAFTYYNFHKNISFFNEYSLGILNVFLLGIFLHFFSFQIYSCIQVLGFSFITTGLVSINDKTRYFLSLIGAFLLTLGSCIGVINGYIDQNISGIALGFFILTLTVFTFYVKLLKKYI